MVGSGCGLTNPSRGPAWGQCGWDGQRQDFPSAPVGWALAQPPGRPKSRRHCQGNPPERLGMGAWPHQELPVGGQQPGTVGLHLAILLAQPKLHREPV